MTATIQTIKQTKGYTCVCKIVFGSNHTNYKIIMIEILGRFVSNLNISTWFILLKVRFYTLQNNFKCETNVIYKTQIFSNKKYS